MPSGVEVQAAESADVKPPITNAEDAVEKKTVVNKETADADAKQEDDGGEEGIEVVLEGRGATKVMESPEKPRPAPNQSIFRHPDAVRPRAMRAPGGPPHHHPPPPYHPHHHPHYLHGSGSWGYGPPPPHEYPPHAVRPPYPVPPYTSSGSFDDQGSYHHHTPHYSPHVHYPPPRYASDVNVISPNHKGDPHYRPPLTPRPRHLPPPPQPYYHYPPTSPVSRPSSGPAGPPRIRDYAMRRSEGAYARAQRADQYHPEDGTWNSYPASTVKSPKAENSRAPPPVVADSFDSEHHSARSSHPPTPGSNAPPPPAPPAPPSSHDPHHQFYGGGGSWGSFDSAAPPPPHYDDRYYGFPPDSPYSPYGAPYSPGGLYQSESFPPPPGYGYPPHPPSFSYSHDEDERLLKDYNPDRDGEHAHKHSRPSKSKARGKSGTPVSSNTSNRNMVLPKAAEEIDFDVTEPPMEPILPPGDIPLCESLADVNTYDVLCGRGGGTNSQVGNRRFRKLVQDFQPTYLMAKRKEKPLIARTIVLIIRKRGGRFLKKNEDTGELFEVGDAKAEAKTSQALREGLDVRATRSAGSLMDKKKKKKTPGSPKTEDDDDDDDDEELEEAASPKSNKSETKETKTTRPPESPPTLPRLQGEEAKAGSVHPHSPEQSQFRKRRRMRSTERYIPDFCPPRADLGRGSPAPEDEDEGVLDVETTPIRRNSTRDDDYEGEAQAQGCAGIALDIVTGAASGSFCLGPSGWRR